MPRGKKKQQKTANGNGCKPLSYKVGKREGGSIIFSGVGDPEELPSKVDKALKKYGFCHSEGLKWRDATCPIGEDSYHELETLAQYVEVQITTKPPLTKRGGAVYTVKIGAAGAVHGKTLTEALIKAHRAWNRMGRQVGGVLMESAIGDAIGK